MEKISILNIDICSIPLSTLLSQLDRGVIFTPNVDHLVRLQHDIVFYESYKRADWVICDSKIVNLASKFLGRSFKEVIPGSSLLPAFYNHHRNNKSIRIFLLGAAEGVAKKAMENINHNVGWDIVVGAHSPSYGFERKNDECDSIVKIINDSKCNVLVVGVGAPKQEKWIQKYKASLKHVDLIMALGATIDFEAGNIKRAPSLFQKFHIEWLFRLLSEPKRLWKRYLIDDLPFFLYIFKQKFGRYVNPFGEFDSITQKGPLGDQTTNTQNG